MSVSLLPRAWKSLTKTQVPNKNLKLLSFNMLADGLAQHGDFVACPAAVLEWHYRRDLILQEIRRADADVVALQELNHAPDLQVELTQMGYDGVWLPKIASPALHFNAPADGCGLFYRKSRFEAIQEPKGQYFQKLNGAGGEGGDGGNASVDASVDMPSASAAGGDASSQASSGFLYAMLRDLEAPGADGVFIVLTTHLKAKAGAANELVRLDQAAQVRRFLETLRPSERVPVLVCGDMNTEPGSAPIRHLLEGPLGLGSLWDRQAWPEEARGASTSDAESFTAPWDPELFTTWKFRTGQPGENVTPEGWKISRRIIDHCMVNAGLEPTEFFSTPRVESVGPGGLPCARYPSDHLSIGFGFRWLSG